MEIRNAAKLKSKTAIEQENKSYLRMNVLKNKYQQSKVLRMEAEKNKKINQYKNRPVEMLDQKETLLYCTFTDEQKQIQKTPAILNLNDRKQTIVQCQSPNFKHSGIYKFEIELYSNTTSEKYFFNAFINLRLIF